MPFENLVREGVYRFHPYFWKPLTCGYVAAGAFFLYRKMVTIFLEAPNLWVRCRKRFFSPPKKRPHISGSP